MQFVDDTLKRATFGFVICRRQSEVSTTEMKEVENVQHSAVDHLLNLGRVNLPHHPIRMRYLPHTKRRYLLYGQKGFEEMVIEEHGLEPYSLQNYSWKPHMCDCVQTSDRCVYAVSRSHSAAVITCYDEFMSRQKFADVSYPLGCLSSLATNLSCSYLYAANPELNCVLRFSSDDLSLNHADKFGDSALWRPFDCCTSQAFTRPDGRQVQFLFVSNVDAGIFVFDIDTMEIVAECGDDLLPGAKYLTYDAKRCLLFVSTTFEQLVRCYKFEVPDSLEPPWLHKIADFLVTSRKSLIRSSGPQCVMWDPDSNHLAVISWSLAKGQFMTKAFRVNIKKKQVEIGTVTDEQ